ncbi:MAG: radical SAM protein [Patescibacteria group bacterium]
MKSVLLVSLRGSFLDSDRVFPPLGILYLKSVLDKNGVYSKLEDEFDFKNIEKYKNFDYIAISITTPQKKEAQLIIQKIKEKFPSKKIIIGGPYASFYTEDSIGLDSDYIVIGDGEKSILEIVLNNTEERILKNELSVDEMNSFPLPFRSNNFLRKYHYKLDGLETTTVMTSRGCPFNCSFCEHAHTKVRYYELERVKDQLIQIVKFGYKAVMFFDDLFAVNQKRVEALCQVIDEFNIKFRCFGHIRCMTSEMAEALAKAGCIETGVGMESGSQKILNTVKFPTPTIEQSHNYVKICHDAGIKVKAFFMLGLPGETKETIKETEEFIATSQIDDFDLGIYYPYKGTKIRDQIQKYDIFLNDNCSIGFYKGKKGSAEVAIRTSALSAEEIKIQQDRIFKKYKKIFKQNII